MRNAVRYKHWDGVTQRKENVENARVPGWLKRYPGSKDSGTEWIRKISGVWEVSATKRVVGVVNGLEMLKGARAVSAE